MPASISSPPENDDAACDVSLSCPVPVLTMRIAPLIVPLNSDCSVLCSVSVTGCAAEQVIVPVPVRFVSTVSAVSSRTPTTSSARPQTAQNPTTTAHAHTSVRTFQFLVTFIMCSTLRCRSRIDLFHSVYKSIIRTPPPVNCEF